MFTESPMIRLSSILPRLMATWKRRKSLIVARSGGGTLFWLFEGWRIGWAKDEEWSLLTQTEVLIILVGWVPRDPGALHRPIQSSDKATGWMVTRDWSKNAEQDYSVFRKWRRLILGQIAKNPISPSNSFLQAPRVSSQSVNTVSLFLAFPAKKPMPLFSFSFIRLSTMVSLLPV